jgi:hypothetical protein
VKRVQKQSAKKRKLQQQHLLLKKLLPQSLKHNTKNLKGKCQYFVLAFFITV